MPLWPLEQFQVYALLAMDLKKGLIIDGVENFESPLQILDFIKRNV